MMSSSPCQAEQRVPCGAAQREDPGVELQLVQDVSEVVDRARVVAMRRRDEAGVLEESVAGFAQVVGPRVGAAAGEWAEAFEVAGVEELAEAALSGPGDAVGPPQFEQLRGGEELVAPDVARRSRHRGAARRTGRARRGGRAARRRRRSGGRRGSSARAPSSPPGRGPRPDRGAPSSGSCSGLAVAVLDVDARSARRRGAAVRARRLAGGPLAPRRRWAIAFLAHAGQRVGEGGGVVCAALALRLRVSAGEVCVVELLHREGVGEEAGARAAVGDPEVQRAVDGEPGDVVG